MGVPTLRIDAGDTAWVCVAAGLVMFMTPGLALFYGGMVRAKNVLAMLMQNVFCLGIVSVLWAVIVYSLAFGGTNKYIGNFSYAWLGHFNTAPPGLALSIPPSLYMGYQLMFAVITPALITGAIADRMRFGAWVWFVGLWVILVYAPVAHWVFAPAGWLFQRGALDFAGGTVVHVNAGVAALAVVLLDQAPARLAGNADAAALAAAHADRHRDLVVRLVRLQRGLGPRRERARRASADQHAPGGGRRDAELARDRALPRRSRDDAGCGVGRGRGLGGDHAVRGIRGRHVADCDRSDRRRRRVIFAINLKFRFQYDDALDVVGVHLAGGIVGIVAARASSPTRP